VPLFVISGRPGAGKSTYCRWLAEHRGYVHVETDIEWDTWGQLLGQMDDASAVDVRNRIRSLGPNVVFEWGFIVALVQRIAQLRMTGVQPWWFDGDIEATRQSYLQRMGPVSIPAYEAQAAAIEASWPQIQRMYRGHIVNVVSAGPTYLSPEEISATLQIP
jgi:hypothetical protein